MSEFHRMGYEGLIFTGTAGSEATTPIPETKDMSMSSTTDKGNTKARNPSGAKPIGTEEVTGINWQFDFQTLNVPDNAVIASLIEAAMTGDPVAFRSKDFDEGKGYDGDVILEMKHGMTLAGEQALDFTCRPTRAGGRWPELYV